MDKKILKLSFVFLSVFVFGSLFLNPVFAEDVEANPDEEIIVEDEVEEEIIPEPEKEKEVPLLLIEEDIILKNGCEVVDTDGITHIFPKEDSPSEYLAICALVAAYEIEYISGFELANSDFGLFVQSINNIQPSDTEFWALWLNGGFADCGIGCLEISEGDILSLILTDWMENTESATITLRVVELVSISQEDEEETPPSSSGGSGGGGSGITTPVFSTPNALAYLKSVQAVDGSFGGSTMYTDWVAIAFGAMNETGISRDLLLSYLSSNNTISSLLTDNQRRAMALLALGQNPYSFNGVNYIEAIVESFDSTQFGDANLVNDDIFALIPLSFASYTISDEIITKAIAFIISKQNANGSWENSIDVTAAGIQALKPFTSVSGVSDSLSRASGYLEDKQGTDGGWGGVSSTSWAMQAMSALSASWTNNSKTGLDYLATEQTNANNNGSVLSANASLQNNIWETSYAIPAGLGKPWSAILQSVSRPITSSGSSASTNDVVNIKPETKAEAELIFCPPGDLFSATTGEACTDIITPAVLGDITSLPVALQSTNNSSTSTSATKVSQAEELAELQATEPEEEIFPNSLTASATNALPIQKIPPAIPVALGTTSGLVLLYVAFKFFFV